MSYRRPPGQVRETECHTAAPRFVSTMSVENVSSGACLGSFVCAPLSEMPCITGCEVEATFLGIAYRRHLLHASSIVGTSVCSSDSGFPVRTTYRDGIESAIIVLFPPCPAALPGAAASGGPNRARCVYSLFDGTCYSDNRSNSRANTYKKPRLLEGMHLLDKRSTRALPVATMIHDNSTDRTALEPATHHSNFCPINFRWLGRPVRLTVCTGRLVPSAGDALLVLTGRVDFDPITLAFGIGVMINRDSRGHSYFIVRDTVLVSTINDADQGSVDVAFRTPPAPYEKSKYLGSGGSMVARLKLKGIDGRAPPGVEPAA
ncbi:hypothetical protein SASPL_154565 [Salvia splendens]|uniref:Uncharacterized protein n=1 Tax=Salvia splendens TaxID=180675 RepID=A0A8X8YZD5_SALSN|nr:hypothetical protein SASPL_154565 [Salvia splendens]